MSDNRNPGQGQDKSRQDQNAPKKPNDGQHSTDRSTQNPRDKDLNKDKNKGTTDKNW